MQNFPTQGGSAPLQPRQGANPLDPRFSHQLYSTPGGSNPGSAGVQPTLNILFMDRLISFTVLVKVKNKPEFNVPFLIFIGYS